MLYAFDFNYAGFAIDAAQDENGQIWISTPTIEKLLDYAPNSIRKLLDSKSFKVFAGEGFELGNFSKKSKSTKSNIANLYYSKEIFLTLLYYVSDYEAYIIGQGKSVTQEKLNTHRKIKNLIFAGFVADFEGSIQNALGNQLTEENREYLRQLVFNRLQAFKGWCDIIHDRYIKFYGSKPEGWVYGKLVKKANIALFGVENFGSDRTANMTEDQQKLILHFETFLARMAGKKPNLEPEALLDYCLDVYA